MTKPTVSSRDSRAQPEERDRFALCAARDNQEWPARGHRDRARISLSDAIYSHRRFRKLLAALAAVCHGTRIHCSVVNSVTPTTPTAFETRNTGVTLEVEPVVGPDGVTIDLNLVPQVVEFEGFINYGSPILSPSSSILNTLTGGIITSPASSLLRT